MTFNHYAKVELQKRGYGKASRRSFWRFLTGDNPQTPEVEQAWKKLHAQLWDDYRRLTGDQQTRQE